MIEKIQTRIDGSELSNEPRVCRIHSDSATDTIDAISSDTAREILSLLHQQPLAVSELADHLDTTIPTVAYHVENLVDAGLVEEVDDCYSEKGRSMSVYAPVTDPLVFVGSADRTEPVRSLLTRVAGAFVVLLVGSLLAQWAVTSLLLDARTPDVIRKSVSAGATEPAVMPIPPGLLFLSGGTFVLAVVVVLWCLTTRAGTETSSNR